MGKKYPSELNTKTVRINIGHYAMLVEISRKADCTIAKALQKLIEKQAEPKAKPVKESPAQIPLEPVVFEIIRATKSVESIQLTGKVEPVRVTTSKRAPTIQTTKEK